MKHRLPICGWCQCIFWHSTEIGSCCFLSGFLIYAGTVVLLIYSSSLRLLDNLLACARLSMVTERAPQPILLGSIRFRKSLPTIESAQLSTAIFCWITVDTNGLLCMCMQRG